MKQVSKYSFILFLGILSSCINNYSPLPKQKAFHRIDYPEKAYQKYTSDQCPFEFEYPTYATIEQREEYFGRKDSSLCWLNINYAQFNAKLHISYKDIQSKDDVEKVLADTRELTWKHTIKAQYIDENDIDKADDIKGVYYSVGGNAASAVQFYLTDSSDHFVRGSLYFNNKPNRDSVQQVLNFLEDDILQFIETFQWH